MRPEERTEIILRLRTAEGHLRAVISMFEDGEPCEQVLYQLSAVRSALRIAGGRLLVCQVKTCEDVIQRCECPEERVAELKRLGNLFQIMMKSYRYNRE
jgi:DNA-binding FrmR family transcriptional regulator